MLILDCKPEEIKNPFEPDDPKISNMFWSGAEEMKQAILAQAHEIDIDKEIYDWLMQVGEKPVSIVGENVLRQNGKSFSQFLQDKLQQER